MVPLSRVSPWRTAKGARLEECHATLFPEELSRADRSCPAYSAHRTTFFFTRNLVQNRVMARGSSSLFVANVGLFVTFQCLHVTEGGGLGERDRQRGLFKSEEFCAVLMLLSERFPRNTFGYTVESLAVELGASPTGDKPTELGPLFFLYF